MAVFIGLLVVFIVGYVSGAMASSALSPDYKSMLDDERKEKYRLRDSHGKLADRLIRIENFFHATLEDE